MSPIQGENRRSIARGKLELRQISRPPIPKAKHVKSFGWWVGRNVGTSPGNRRVDRWIAPTTRRTPNEAHPMKREKGAHCCNRRSMTHMSVQQRNSTPLYMQPLAGRPAPSLLDVQQGLHGLPADRALSAPAAQLARALGADAHVPAGQHHGVARGAHADHTLAPVDVLPCGC